MINQLIKEVIGKLIHNETNRTFNTSSLIFVISPLPIYLKMFVKLFHIDWDVY